MWTLDPSITFLNHGSFGACPKAVLEQQAQFRELLEREPVRFFTHEYEPLLLKARNSLATFVGTQPENLVFVSNATTGVNTVLRSIGFKTDDEILITNHSYNACSNAAYVTAEQTGANVRVVEIPFPLQDPREVIDRVLQAITDKTKLVLIDHITSPTALILPLQDLIGELSKKNVDVLVDGAHAPGMVPLNLDSLGATYYTANCHKWMCAPKGVAFLHVRSDKRQSIRPLVISHGHNSPRTDRSRFHEEFDWTGTQDPTAWLAIPSVIQTMASVVPGGWKEIMKRNHDLAVRGRTILCETLQIDPPAPADVIGSMASMPLSSLKQDTSDPIDPWQRRLFDEHAIEVPIFTWPLLKQRFLRISAQLYNSEGDYKRLAQALKNMIS